MEGDFIKINKWLRPLSWLYGLGVGFRNMLFEMGILKSRSFPTPVISVGNITVGGTGKTPHTEYLVKMLLDRYHVAVLSRGYKRKSKGYRLADNQSTADTIGDEPMQMKMKFPNAVIAVDKDRCHGIDMLTANDNDIDVIVLDDAFQHRYVKPKVNILLVDYHRLIIYDELLPSGRLREPVKGKDRADIVIVTKCPQDLKPMDFRVVTKALNLYPYQKLYFTSLAYAPLYKVFGHNKRKETAVNRTHRPLSSLGKNESVLLVTGIASPDQIKVDLQPYTQNVKALTFPDHHKFKPKDVALINSEFAAMPKPKIIVTTEKDATRLVQLDTLSKDVKANIYVLPIEIQFMLDQEQSFVDDILAAVQQSEK